MLGLNVVVILLGALVRATGSGAGCGRSWPTCVGQVVPPLEGATAIEFTHRAVSGLALIAVGVLAVLVWRNVPRGEPARTGAALSVIAIVGEALIGAMIVLAEWVADDTSTARAISVPLHLLNTFFLLAALALTIFWLDGGGRLDPRRDRADDASSRVRGCGAALARGNRSDHRPRRHSLPQGVRDRHHGSGALPDRPPHRPPAARRGRGRRRGGGWPPVPLLRRPDGPPRSRSWSAS